MLCLFHSHRLYHNAQINHIFMSQQQRKWSNCKKNIISNVKPILVHNHTNQDAYMNDCVRQRRVTRGCGLWPQLLAVGVRNHTNQDAYMNDCVRQDRAFIFCWTGHRCQITKKSKCTWHAIQQEIMASVLR
jgi:hypothetical protein